MKNKIVILILLFLISFISNQAFSDYLEYERATYEGETFYGEPHGRGKMEFLDGEIYTGQYKFGYRHGRGEVIWSDGASYKGEFKNGTLDGKGTFTYAEGHVYVGEFKEGLFHGKAEVTFTDGDKFIGTYKNDYRYEGKLIKPDGTIIEGKYPENGKADGEFKFTYADGTVELFNFKDGEIIE